MSAGQAFERLRDAVRAASQSGSALRLRGGGTKDFYGEEPRGELLDTRGYAGIVSYDPSELVVTARCGTLLVELEAALGERAQMLAFEPPHYGEAGQATVGGMVAAGLSGPRRASAGAVRDFVLGTRLLDGLGRELGFGGQVMKNVAGYDISRLMAGSLGTLAVILEVSLKTQPRPVAEATLELDRDAVQAIDSLNRWAATRVPVSASAWCADRLRLRLSGAASAVNDACRSLGGKGVEPGEASAYWKALRDHADPFFARAATLWRLSVPATAPASAFDALAGSQLIEWGGALRWLAGDAPAQAVREAAARVGGHATLFRGAARSGVFHPLPPVLMKIHRELKATFDPRGVFNPGRMYADF